MKKFSDLGVVVASTTFTGNKVDIYSILNQEITVHAFKIEKSKYEKGHGNCLHLQISINGTMHVLFSGSGNLMNTIEQIKKEDFPFTTTIKKNDKRIDFT